LVVQQCARKNITLAGSEGDLAAAEEEEDLELAFQQRAQESLLNVGKEHPGAVLKWNDQKWDYYDVALIYVRGGNGGNGCKAFRREKNVPFGGPSGGNGGHGGNVYLTCCKDATTLKEFKKRESFHYAAQDGKPGLGKKLDGRNGKHSYIRVPPGSCVYVRDSWVKGQPKGKANGKEELLRYEDVGERNFVGELTGIGQTLRVARGGRGGRGNLAFKTHYNTAPWLAELGAKGLGRWIEIELKTLADIGIIGAPNAGKSSLLSAVTNKEAKIAAYPFTTVEPNVGHFARDEHGGLTLVDIPGLIEGAHEGRGMGFQFLRHVERCRALIHVVAGNSENPTADFDRVQAELGEYSSEVAAKPQVVVVNKCDIPEVQAVLPELLAALRKRAGHSRVFDVSVATRYHVDDLMSRIVKWYKALLEGTSLTYRGVPSNEASVVMDSRRLVQMCNRIEPVSRKEALELDPEAPKGRRLKKNAIQPRVEWDVLERAWRLKHPEVERVAAMTNWDYDDAADRFNRVCKATGMTEAMTAQGIKSGEEVVVGTHKFHYEPVKFGSESRMLVYDMNMDF